MNPDLRLAKSVAKLSDEFFTQERNRERLPFVHGYPKNSCEVVSAVLALAMAQRFPTSSLFVAKAYCHDKNEWHYWVEIDYFVIDLTARQFLDFEEPVVCIKPSPLKNIFTNLEYISGPAALQQFPPELQRKLELVAAELYSKIAA